MKTGMVSVRLPTSLIEELRARVKRDHFLDVGEAVRTILRNEWKKRGDLREK